MSPETMRRSLMTHLFSNWTKGEPPALKTPIKWYNHNFTIPADTIWIEPVTRFGPITQGEKGDSGLALRSGELVVHVHIPLGMGGDDGHAMAGELESLFSRRSLSDVECDDAYTRESRDSDSREGFSSLEVVVPFHGWTAA